jgi:hypothetical protein
MWSFTVKEGEKDSHVTKSGDDFEDLGVDGRIILKLI